MDKIQGSAILVDLRIETECNEYVTLRDKTCRAIFYVNMDKTKTYTVAKAQMHIVNDTTLRAMVDTTNLPLGKLYADLQITLPADMGTIATERTEILRASTGITIVK